MHQIFNRHSGAIASSHALLNCTVTKRVKLNRKAALILPLQVCFIEGDALNLPDSVGTADAVMSFESACYMPDKR